MITREITIGGVAVKTGYCFATEIAFKQYTGVNIEDMNTQDPEHIIYLILSAIIPYYKSIEQESPVNDKEIMYKANSKELIAALTTVLDMRREFYDVPKGDEVKGDDAEEDPKNA